MGNFDSQLNAILNRETLPASGVDAREIDYVVEGNAFRGYIARPADALIRPAVLVVHDWYGVTDHVRMRAEMLARLGYIAFAADLFGANVRPTPAEAPGVIAQFYSKPLLWRSRVTGAFERLLDEANLDPARCGAIGYCFGGASVLQLARTGASLQGVVSFHGNLPTGSPGEASLIKAKLLILHGASDPHVSDEEVLTYINDLRSAPSLDWQLTFYSGAMHAFAVPGANSPEHGVQYDSVAEQRSWLAMKSFFAEIFS